MRLSVWDVKQTKQRWLFTIVDNNDYHQDNSAADDNDSRCCSITSKLLADLCAITWTWSMNYQHKISKKYDIDEYDIHEYDMIFIMYMVLSME